MSLLNKTINNLLLKNISISTAESCTGGLLSYNFIKHKGISKIFKNGFICYSNESKIKFLKINKSILKKNGAVSSVIAKNMVENLFKITKSNLCITTTGIAGPTGGTKNKPVGLVFIAIKFKNKTKIFKKKFKGTRVQIQKKVISYIFKEINNLI
tara:strand:+ start:730 stop:1194 length:465 start_codon:yes stop_codon:yes gene_type:complete